MSEHKEPIPSMIYNAAVGGHVTNSQQIIDENLNREQQDINEEVAAVPYNATTPNGMGKIVLKKNDNFKQVVEAQTDGNTIFVIKYDYTLTGDVNVPANCVLEFDGGSISAGSGENMDTITGNNTYINSPISKIFDIDLNISGTWNITEAYSEWFGAIGDGSNDDAPAINKTLESFYCVKLMPKSYLIGSVDSNGKGIKVPAYRTLKGTYHDENMSKVTSIIMMKEGLNYTSCVDIIGKNCVLEDFSVRGRGVNGVETACVSGLGGYSRCTLNRIDVAGTYYGFNLHLYLTNMTQCNATYCQIGFYIHGSSGSKYTTFVAICCYACDCRLRGHYWEYMTYSSMISCAADGCGNPTSGTVDSNTQLDYAYYFKNCDSINIINSGCEKCLRVIYCNSSQAVAFKNCNFLMSKAPNSTIDASFVISDIINLRYTVEVEIDNCIINTETLTSYFTSTTRLILLYGSPVNYRLLIYKPNSYGYINISNINCEGGLSIYRNLDYITTRYCRNSTEGTKPEFDNAYEKAYYRGFMFFDGTLTPARPTWWNGTAWVDATGATV